MKRFKIKFHIESEMPISVEIIAESRKDALKLSKSTLPKSVSVEKTQSYTFDKDTYDYVMDWESK